MERKALDAIAIARDRLRRMRGELRGKERGKDRVHFFLGTMVYAALCFLIGAAPWAVERVFLGFLVFGMPLRALYYVKKKWQYFLLDFCYFVNLLVAAYFVFRPEDKRMEAMSFVLAEGPVGGAIVAWRCQWVFGSMDHQISFLLHFLPGLALFTHRYHGRHENLERNCVHFLYPEGMCRYKSLDPELQQELHVDWSPFTWYFLAPTLFYCTWQLFYFLVVQVLLRETIKKDKELDTSYRHLSKRAKKANNIWHKIVNRGSIPRRIMMYGFVQLLYTVLTMGMATLIFGSYRATACWQLIKLMWGMWQGSKYQIDVVPKRMLEEVVELELLKGGDPETNVRGNFQSRRYHAPPAAHPEVSAIDSVGGMYRSQASGNTI